MLTQNKKYHLPNKNHDVVDDINDMVDTLKQIDSDVNSLEQTISEKSEIVSDLENRAVHFSSALLNSEIQNIAPNRYVVVNTEGNGFECIDSGGDTGGTIGQVSIKKTNVNFDTAWGNMLDISKNGMTTKENAETSQTNESHIFSDEAEIENESQLPKVNLTNVQTCLSIQTEVNESVLICDSVEQTNNNEIQIATTKNFGLVKIGDGINIINGTISTAIYPEATKERAGIIKIGDGVYVDDGTITKEQLDPATFSKFGVVKLGENLSLNVSGEMEINEMANATTIYNLGNVKICDKGIVVLEEQTLIYRLTVTEDIVVHFECNFEPKSDFSFVLEIVSNGTHLISFNECLKPEMPLLPINRGTTKITFNKKLGTPYYGVEISKLNAPNPILLTPSIDNCISSEFIITSPQGGLWAPYSLLKTNYNGFCDIKELNFKFETLVCVDYVNYLSRSSTAAMGEFILSGSNDGKNWTTLLYRNGEIIYGKIYTELKGCFRYFNLKIGYTSDDNKPGAVTLWGTQIDNNESEITLLTPYITSDTTGSVTITANNITRGSTVDLLDKNCDSLLRMSKTGDDWIKYEFAEAKAANVLELHFRGSGEYYGFYGDRHPNWFKLEGSNDDENWTLLLERCQLGSCWGYPNNFVFFDFNNKTAYKYYKFTCLGTASTASEWGLCGFKLYCRDNGKHNSYSLVPILTSNSQDGYEVTTSSNYNDSHIPFYAFDNDASTKWGTKAPQNNNPEWMQIKLPTASICNIVTISARPEGDNIYKETPTEFDIQGSNDGNSWNTLTSQTGVVWSANGQTQNFLFENETEYLYYRILMKKNTYIASGTNKPYSFGEIVFGNRFYEYKRVLRKYDYLVPQLTSNSSASGYEVSASTFASAREDAWTLFDRSDDGWASARSVNTNAEIKITLPTAQSCDLFYIYTNNYSSRNPKTFRFEGSNNNVNWTILYQESNNANLSTNSHYYFENSRKNTAYKYYRFYILTNNGDVHIGLREFNLIKEILIQEY